MTIPKTITLACAISALLIATLHAEDRYLGKLGGNRFDRDSTSNPIGQYGSSISSKSINNPIGEYGSSIRSKSANNPFAANPPKLYNSDGEYLSKLSSNKFDPESISNPIGQYGSSISPKSINNPTGRYGSSISPHSPTNPFATDPPVIVYEDY